MKYCTFCKPHKVSAIYRNRYLEIDDKISFACEDHKDLLIDGSKKPISTEENDETDLTEADYQTWMRI